MELIISIFAVVTSIAGVIISLISLNHNKIEAVNAFYNNDRTPQFIEARRVVHTLQNEYNLSEIQKEFGDQIAYLILSYDQAGILVKKKQLPFWVFSKGACGVAAVTFYKKLLPYIKCKRKENPLYAGNFEYLVNMIIRKGKLQNFLTSI